MAWPLTSYISFLHGLCPPPPRPPREKSPVILSALKSLSRPRRNSKELLVKVANGRTWSAVIIHGARGSETQGNSRRKLLESLVLGRGQWLLDRHWRPSKTTSLHSIVKEMRPRRGRADPCLCLAWQPKRSHLTAANLPFPSQELYFTFWREMGIGPLAL